MSLFDGVPFAFIRATYANSGDVVTNLRVAPLLSAKVDAGTAAADGHGWRLAALGVADDAQLAGAIRAGDLDDRWDDVVTALAATALDKVRVANPRYLRVSDVV